MVNEAKKLIQNLINSDDEKIFNMKLHVYVEKPNHIYSHSNFSFITDEIPMNITVHYRNDKQSNIYLNNFKTEILSTDANELVDLIAELKKRAHKAYFDYIKKLNNSF